MSTAWHSSTEIPAVADWPFQTAPDTKLAFHLKICNQQRSQQPLTFCCMAILTTNYEIAANTINKMRECELRGWGIHREQEITIPLLKEKFYESIPWR